MTIFGASEGPRPVRHDWLNHLTGIALKKILLILSKSQGEFF